MVTFINALCAFHALGERLLLSSSYSLVSECPTHPYKYFSHRSSDLVTLLRMELMRDYSNLIALYLAGSLFQTRIIVSKKSEV